MLLIQQNTGLTLKPRPSNSKLQSRYSGSCHFKHPPNRLDYFLKGSLTVLDPIQSSQIYIENLSGKAQVPQVNKTIPVQSILYHIVKEVNTRKLYYNSVAYYFSLKCLKMKFKAFINMPQRACPVSCLMILNYLIFLGVVIVF